MDCNEKRTCDPNVVFAGAANPLCTDIFNPANFQYEQLLFDTGFKEIINSRGIWVDYYVHSFNTETADLLYGEEPTAPFVGPTSIKMYIELEEPSFSYAQYGIVSEDSFTGYLHIDTFVETMSVRGQNLVSEEGEFLTSEDGSYITNNVNVFDLFNQRIEPKAGDLVVVTPLGCDRPWGRSAKVFEISERMDQDVSSINPLMGHYVWRLKAKRYEHSFEPNAPREDGDEQVFDNAFSGKEMTTLIPPVTSEPKSYDWDINQESQEKVFNMDVNNNDIYGDYY